MTCAEHRRGTRRRWPSDEAQDKGLSPRMLSISGIYPNLSRSSITSGAEITQDLSHLGSFWRFNRVNFAPIVTSNWLLDFNPASVPLLTECMGLCSP